MEADGVTIEWCVNNVDPESRTRLLEADCNHEQQYCLLRCGTCHEQPFVLRNGELIRGSSQEDLLRTVLEGVSEDE